MNDFCDAQRLHGFGPCETKVIIYIINNIIHIYIEIIHYFFEKVHKFYKKIVKTYKL